MIYTVVSLADVFAEQPTAYIIDEKTKYGYAEYITVNGKKQLRRLISTDPADYLKL